MMMADAFENDYQFLLDAILLNRLELRSGGTGRERCTDYVGANG